MFKLELTECNLYKLLIRINICIGQLNQIRLYTVTSVTRVGGGYMEASLRTRAPERTAHVAKMISSRVYMRIFQPGPARLDYITPPFSYINNSMNMRNSLFSSPARRAGPGQCVYMGKTGSLVYLARGAGPPKCARVQLIWRG